MGEEALKNFGKKYKVTLPSVENCDGLCYQNSGIAAVYLKEDSSRDYRDTLIHESVHVWQHFAEYISEETPGDEMEAYFIAHIATTLLKEYERQAALKEPTCPS